MDCPVCEEPLVVIERHGIELDYCFECHGLWFSKSELTMLAEAMDSDIYLPDLLSLPAIRDFVAQDIYRCPRCDRRMEKFRMGNSILLDRCPVGDGLWFDQGELEDVIHYYREHYHPSKAPNGEAMPILEFVGATFAE